MNEDTLSLAMFWVGVLFVFTPILVAGVVIGSTWYFRKKRKSSAAP